MSTIQLVSHTFNRILPKRKMVAMSIIGDPPFCQSYPYPNTGPSQEQEQAGNFIGNDSLHLRGCLCFFSS